MKKVLIPWLILVILLAFTNSAHSQNDKIFVECSNESFAVNSIGNLLGNTRIIRSVDLPKGTETYIFRVTLEKINREPIVVALIDAVKKYSPKNISIGVSLGEFIINNSDGLRLNTYIFTNANQANTFASGKEAYTCQNYLGLMACCNTSNSCINSRKVYFGFENTNIGRGVQVKLEVIAIVSKPTEPTYSTPAPNTQNTTTTKSNAYNKDDFVGKWKDENSIFAMSDDGSFYIQWQDGKTASGRWQLIGNKLNFDFSGVVSNQYKENDFYKIQSWDGTTLKYQQYLNGVYGITYTAQKTSQ